MIEFFDLPRSVPECPDVNQVNVNDPLDPGSEPYVSRASLQDDVQRKLPQTTTYYYYYYYYY